MWWVCLVFSIILYVSVHFILICLLVSAIERSNIWVHNFRFNFNQNKKYFSIFSCVVQPFFRIFSWICYDLMVEFSRIRQWNFNFEYLKIQMKSFKLLFLSFSSRQIRWINNGKRYKRLFMAFLKIGQFTDWIYFFLLLCVSLETNSTILIIHSFFHFASEHKTKKKCKQWNEKF